MPTTRPLDPVETRVLGALMEKEQATPDAYPLTVNALLTACNQKTNREPVTELTETEVVEALDRLRLEALTWRSDGARVERWEHRLDRRWQLDGAKKAVMTLLLLRGAQTAGELKARSGRLHAFDALSEVESTLHALAGDGLDDLEALVVEQARRPGQRDRRWMHLAGAGDALEPPTDDAVARSLAPTPTAVHGPSVLDRLEALEAKVSELDHKLGDLLDQLG
ncbi:MAG: YceH family protein [Acidobacteriota bacterium]